MRSSNAPQFLQNREAGVSSLHFGHLMSIYFPVSMILVLLLKTYTNVYMLDDSLQPHDL